MSKLRTVRCGECCEWIVVRWNGGPLRRYCDTCRPIVKVRKQRQAYRLKRGLPLHVPIAPGRRPRTYVYNPEHRSTP